MRPEPPPHPSQLQWRVLILTTMALPTAAISTMTTTVFSIPRKGMKTLITTASPIVSISMQMVMALMTWKSPVYANLNKIFLIPIAMAKLMPARPLGRMAWPMRWSPWKISQTTPGMAKRKHPLIPMPTATLTFSIWTVTMMVSMTSSKLDLQTPITTASRPINPASITH